MRLRKKNVLVMMIAPQGQCELKKTVTMPVQVNEGNFSPDNFSSPQSSELFHKKT